VLYTSATPTLPTTFLNVRSRGAAAHAAFPQQRSVEPPPTQGREAVGAAEHESAKHHNNSKCSFNRPAFLASLCHLRIKKQPSTAAACLNWLATYHSTAPAPRARYTTYLGKGAIIIAFLIFAHRQPPGQQRSRPTKATQCTPPAPAAMQANVCQLIS